MSYDHCLELIRLESVWMWYCLCQKNGHIHAYVACWKTHTVTIVYKLKTLNRYSNYWLLLLSMFVLPKSMKWTYNESFGCFYCREGKNYPHLSLPYKYDNHGFYKHHYFMPDNMELEVLPTEKAFRGLLTSLRHVVLSKIEAFIRGV